MSKDKDIRAAQIFTLVCIGWAVIFFLSEMI